MPRNLRSLANFFMCREYAIAKYLLQMLWRCDYIRFMQTKPLSPDSQAIFDIAKSANDAYLQAHRVGYEAGWTAAMKHAIEIMSKPLGEPKL